MFNRLFVDHPKSVDEGYWEHFGVAARFALTMIWGGLCGLVHAVVPGLCVKTGSNTVRRLNQIIVINRAKKGEDVAQMLTVDWVI